MTRKLLVSSNSKFLTLKHSHLVYIIFLVIKYLVYQSCFEIAQSSIEIKIENHWKKFHQKKFVKKNTIT